MRVFHSSHHRSHQRVRNRRRVTCDNRMRHFQKCCAGHCLQRFPFRERVCFNRHELEAVFHRQLVFNANRRAKITVCRDKSVCCVRCELKFSHLINQQNDIFVLTITRLTRLRIDLCAVSGECRHTQRNWNRLLLCLAWRRAVGLSEAQARGIAAFDLNALNGDRRCAGLAIPCAEARQIKACSFLEAFIECFDGRRCAVILFKVEVHTALEGIRTDISLERADKFCAFFIDGGGVEVVDGRIAIRTHWVCERACIFGKLTATQADNVFNALNRARSHVSGEFLIAEDGQAFFQAQLEPVTACDAVAGPVVEVFVGDNALNRFEIAIGGGFCVRQNIG